MNWEFSSFDHSIDVISINETKLDETIKSCEVHIPGYEFIRRHRNRHGGGVWWPSILTKKMARFVLRFRKRRGKKYFFSKIRESILKTEKRKENWAKKIKTKQNKSTWKKENKKMNKKKIIKKRGKTKKKLRQKILKQKKDEKQDKDNNNI